MDQKSREEIINLAHEYWGASPVDERSGERPRYDIPPEREQYSIDQIQQEIGREMQCINERILRIYSLILLLAAKHCDDFYKVKREFVKDDLPYGKIVTRVRQHRNGTNQMEFGLRVLQRCTDGNSDSPSWKPIKRKANGYMRQTFKSHSKISEEVELAHHTENEYKKLRDFGKYLKGVVRKFNDSEYMKTYGELLEGED